MLDVLQQQRYATGNPCLPYSRSLQHVHRCHLPLMTVTDTHSCSPPQVCVQPLPTAAQLTPSSGAACGVVSCSTFCAAVVLDAWSLRASASPWCADGWPCHAFCRLYAFDVHCNSFFPLFLLLYGEYQLVDVALHVPYCTCSYACRKDHGSGCSKLCALCIWCNTTKAMCMAQLWCVHITSLRPALPLPPPCAPNPAWFRDHRSPPIPAEPAAAVEELCVGGAVQHPVCSRAQLLPLPQLPGVQRPPLPAANGGGQRGGAGSSWGARVGWGRGIHGLQCQHGQCIGGPADVPADLCNF
jgi:hypothetical protein